MGLYDVPKGVVPVTALLKSTVGVNAQVVGTFGVNHNISLGPGYVIGIHGWMTSTEDPAASSGQYYSIQLINQGDLTAPIGLPDPRILAARSTILSGPGSSFGSVHDEVIHVVWPVPILVAQEKLTAAGDNSVGGTSHWMSQLEYAIYEVDEGTFVRIAGLSLSRQS